MPQNRKATAADISTLEKCFVYLKAHGANLSGMRGASLDAVLSVNAGGHELRGCVEVEKNVVDGLIKKYFPQSN